MRPERLQLLDDVMADAAAPARRQATLHAGWQALQRRRQLRFASRLSLAGAVAVVLGVSLQEFIGVRHPESPPGVVAPSDAGPKTTVSVEFITDDQLLALFPGTPVGLGTAGGKTRLLFPRPGDEARFVTGLADSAWDHASHPSAN